MSGMFDDLAVSYRPVVALTVCATCGGAVASYGRTVTTTPDAPSVGIDVSAVDLCHGHAIRA